MSLLAEIQSLLKTDYKVRLQRKEEILQQRKEALDPVRLSTKEIVGPQRGDAAGQTGGDSLHGIVQAEGEVIVRIPEEECKYRLERLEDDLGAALKQLSLLTAASSSFLRLRVSCSWS